MIPTVCPGLRAPFQFSSLLPSRLHFRIATACSEPVYSISSYSFFLVRFLRKRNALKKRWVIETNPIPTICSPTNFDLKRETVKLRLFSLFSSVISIVAFKSVS
jgi:hypothetical protein